MINESAPRAGLDAISPTAGLRRIWAFIVLALALSLVPGSHLVSGGTSFYGAPGSVSVEMLVANVGFADFGTEQASPDARHVADWIAASGDSAHSEFVIVDKKFARVYVFDAEARLRGSAPVLLGAARGDDSVADIGTRPIADVRPEERTTPAGRFVAERGRNASDEDVIWVDYDAAVSMHRVRTTNAAEQRLKRLATPTVDDNRISYGCINVPVEFYESHIRPLFALHRAVVYVLPEVKPVQQVFGSYDVRAQALRDEFAKRPALASAQPIATRTEH